MSFVNSRKSAVLEIPHFFIARLYWPKLMPGINSFIFLKLQSTKIWILKGFGPIIDTGWKN
jgi:hypothetical protein